MNCKKVANHITDWLISYVNETPMSTFVVGVSGGIDSALVARLCANTKYPTILLNMPLHQADSEYKRAANQIENLVTDFKNVTALTIDLTKSFDTFQSALPESTSLHNLSMANSKARLRMITLYAVGQANNALVVGTGNKIEDFGIGFFTKYGDGGVDLSPIGDLFKSEVRELATYLGVNKEIIDAPPTDGLWADQRNDEDQIGASYEELELAMLFKENKTKITPRQQEVLTIYKRLHKQNKHKMTPIPVCDLKGIKEI